MCLFPKQNTNIRSSAYVAGLREFSCGKCPECLNKRSNEWALRAVYQAKESKQCCMVTLTYDTYIYNERGEIVGENLNLRNVDKRDCQLFMKRLREYFERKKDITDIKYLITAEYGKKTGRPHYHALLFGVDFDDCIAYKQSKRGNSIYRSKTLEKLWKHGICTVDSRRMSAGIAKYCTKYCCKDLGIDDTFMLCSHGIGLNKLIEEFNGLNYYVDGREYPIPKLVWNKVIEKRYISMWKKYKVQPTYKYKNMCVDFKYYLPYRKKPYVVKQIMTQDSLKAYLDNYKARKTFRKFRDGDKQYKVYRAYWDDKNAQRFQVGAEERIRNLDDKRYHNYKSACLKYLRREIESGFSACISKELPRSNYVWKKPDYSPASLYRIRHLPAPSRHIRANDRKKAEFFVLGSDLVFENSPIFSFPKKKRENIQLSIDI